MMMTITLGSWIIPLIITIFLVYSIGKDDPYGIGLFMVAIPFSLISWLVWALLR